MCLLVYGHYLTCQYRHNLLLLLSLIVVQVFTMLKDLRIIKYTSCL